jgi:ATP-dependent DNA helicase DinG
MRSAAAARSPKLLAVERFFTPGGRLEHVLPGYEPRAEQLQLAQAVERALDCEEHLLAEAGTGTGKSLAYLVPALESGRRVVVATATKALQEQLLTKDVPVAAAALGRPVDVAVLKGRQNYVCRKSLHGFELLGSALLPRAADAAAFDAMLPWLEATDTGDRAELELEPPPMLWEELAVGSDRCLGRRCPFARVCFSETARERAGAAQLVIVNHALYFADLGLRERADGAAVLPDHDAVVFDEAHRLEETAATWLGGRVSAVGIRRLLRDVDRDCREAGRAAPAHALDRVEREARQLFEAVSPPAGRLRLRHLPAERGLALTAALAELADRLTGRGDQADALARQAAGLAGDVAVCFEVDDSNRVAWAEPDAVAWAPVDVGPALRDQLWDAGPTSILLSATLAVREDFGFVRDRLGLARTRELAVGSPFDFGEQTLLYLPRSMPDPRSETASERVAEEVLALFGISAGRALVLTTSYRSLEALAERVRGRLPYPLLVQGDASRERLLERFRAEPASVLLATGTFWQGVDVPGDALSLLVIEKLPFAAPGDPLVEARCERIAAGGGDWFGEYALPVAVLQLKQGFGRLIRSHGDRGVVAILDPRLRTRPYGRAFLAALPSCPIAEDRAAVSEFFAAGTLATA